MKLVCSQTESKGNTWGNIKEIKQYIRDDEVKATNKCIHLQLHNETHITIIHAHHFLPPFTSYRSSHTHAHTLQLRDGTLVQDRQMNRSLSCLQREIQSGEHFTPFLPIKSEHAVALTEHSPFTYYVCTGNQQKTQV